MGSILKIAQIAPTVRRIPPPAYGGSEQIVSLLVEELVKRGHRVTLFASGDSITAAQLESRVPVNLAAAGITQRGDDANANLYDLINAAACFERASNFDIIHNHAAPATMMLANLSPTPVLTTFHNNLNRTSLAVLLASNSYYSTISLSAKGRLPNRRFAGVVYNAIDCKTFPFAAQGSGYLLSLARISREKGTHIAIEVAKRLGRRLIVAGNVNKFDKLYFRQKVEPQIDGRLISYFGEVDGNQKRELYAGADCFLFPIQWQEPFGMTMIEAMVCGTPVIAFDRGAVREVLLHGETGFIVNDLDEMVEAVKKIDTIDRQRCRSYVERNFDVSCMVDNYLAIYERILKSLL